MIGADSVSAVCWSASGLPFEASVYGSDSSGISDFELSGLGKESDISYDISLRDGTFTASPGTEKIRRPVDVQKPISRRQRVRMGYVSRLD